MILKVLKIIARVLPPLANFINKIVDSLAARSLSSEEIISGRLEHLDQKDPRSLEVGRADEAVLETKEVKLPPENVETGDSTARSSQELALRQIEQDFQDSRVRKSKRLDRLISQESLVFRLMIVFAIVSLAFIVWGGYLIFQRGLNILSILTEFVGIIGGSGSLILRQLQGALKSKAQIIEAEQDKQTNYLRAIQTSLALHGPERDKELAETAKWLREQVKN
jgi:hypothetical protein